MINSYKILITNYDYDHLTKLNHGGTEIEYAKKVKTSVLYVLINYPLKWLAMSL